MTTKQTGPDMSGVPSWVSSFRRWGVPVAAIIVLVLCAPGEQHLGDLAGWGSKMSWGLSGLFTLYAGLAAVISTQLPKGARGKTSSVWGAFLSLLLAMAAQPVSHLFVTGYLTADPKPPLWLVGIVSSIPPLILGHLLHFAAMGAGERPVRPAQDTAEDVRQDTTPAVRPAVQTPVPSRPAAVQAVRPAGQRVSLDKRPVRPALAAGQDTGQPTPIKDKQSLSARALELLAAGQDKDTVRDTLTREFTSPDGQAPKPDSVRKALERADKKLSA
jgi:hypothetical protein